MTKRSRASTSTAISTANLAAFLTRLSVEVEAMRARMFDHERASQEAEKFLGIAGHPEYSERLRKIRNCRNHLYIANAMLVAAQLALQGGKQPMTEEQRKTVLKAIS